MNMCPLTYVYDEFDSDFTLTPAHSLMSRFEPLLVTTTDIVVTMMMTTMLLRILQQLCLIPGRRVNNN